MASFWMIALFLALAGIGVPMCAAMGVGAFVGLLLIDVPLDTLPRYMLHDVRSVTLNVERLALVAVRAGLHKHLSHNSNALFNQMDSFVVAAEAAVAAAASAQQLGSAAEAWDHVLTHLPFGLDTVCAPKVLSDLVEALAGAVFLDCGGNVDAVWAAMEPLLAPLPWLDPAVFVPAHPVRRIHVRSFFFLSFCACMAVASQSSPPLFFAGTSGQEGMHSELSDCRK